MNSLLIFKPFKVLLMRKVLALLSLTYFKAIVSNPEKIELTKESELINFTGESTETIKKLFEKAINTSELLKFEIIIFSKFREDLSSTILNSETQISAQIAPFNFRFNPLKKLLTPIVLIIFMSSSEELSTILKNVDELHRINYRQTNWSPILFIINNDVQNKEYNVLKIPPIIGVSSDIYLLSINFNSSSYNLEEIYSIRSKVFREKIKIFSKSDIFSQIIYKTSRRSNFQMALVIGMGMDDPEYPLATKFKASNASVEFESGFEVEIFNYFKDSLNFTSKAVRGTGYIRQSPNGTLTGQAVQINNEEGDISIGAAEFLEYRFKEPTGITYIHPTFHANVLAFFKQPPASSVRNIFTQTFTFNLWISVIALWVIIVSLIKTFYSCIKKKKLSFDNERDRQIAEDAVLFGFASICQQGFYCTPISTSLKVLFFSAVLFGSISYIAYNAALVSILSVKVVPIQSFADLLTENFYIASDSHIPTAKVVVKELEDSGKIKKLNEDVRNIEIGENLDKLLKSKFSIVTISDSFYPILQGRNYSENFVCSTISTKVVSPRPLKSSAFVRRGSPLREYFNYKLLSMQERGIKNKLIRDYVRDTSIQCSSVGSDSHYISLGLRDVFSAMVFFPLALLFSFLIWTCEKSWSVMRGVGKENL